MTDSNPENVTDHQRFFSSRDPQYFTWHFILCYLGVLARQLHSFLYEVLRQSSRGRAAQGFGWNFSTLPIPPLRWSMSFQLDPTETSGGTDSTPGQIKLFHLSTKGAHVIAQTKTHFGQQHFFKMRHFLPLHHSKLAMSTYLSSCVRLLSRRCKISSR